MRFYTWLNFMLFFLLSAKSMSPRESSHEINISLIETKWSDVFTTRRRFPLPHNFKTPIKEAVSPSVCSFLWKLWLWRSFHAFLELLLLPFLFWKQRTLLTKHQHVHATRQLRQVLKFHIVFLVLLEVLFFVNWFYHPKPHMLNQTYKIQWNASKPLTVYIIL